ncbi:FAD-binding molybdopterin dehydrogenase [Mycolicibacterium sp. TY66]|uniref:FAD binding domain-containing protein n=1 Tax=unclassified Mycolicibacterium TaxID=2636767 RepID=UPI001BB33843|nr:MULTISPECIES: FAD binding domain-containing protein [unclassified Mycolicibacterium]BCI82411.1 FAD-binding molybdopterin dehydrogenase [Mycolicibacterium sp. TY66]BCJ79942.1 FAD-binding molybdopterin dehydrogenase [Mycolicibacterium sp. TY81]
MDLHTVSRYRFARTRDDLRLADGESFVAGGTWTFSEPQAELAGVVDLTTMDWCPIERTGDGLRIAATCTIAELVRHPRRAEWPAQQLFGDCADALLASFKIWNVATVGGNICRSFAAASMVSLAVALDGVAEIWTPDDQTRWEPVADLVTGNGINSLAHGEVLRALHLPERALRSTAALRTIALAEYGRSGAVVSGRRDDDGSAVFTVTAATLAPTVFRYPAMPGAEALRSDVLAASGYYTDPLGSADWRRAVSAVLAVDIRSEISSRLEVGHAD